MASLQVGLPSLFICHLTPGAICACIKCKVQVSRQILHRCASQQLLPLLHFLPPGRTPQPLLPQNTSWHFAHPIHPTQCMHHLCQRKESSPVGNRKSTPPRSLCRRAASPPAKGASAPPLAAAPQAGSGRRTHTPTAPAPHRRLQTAHHGHTAHRHQTHHARIRLHLTCVHNGRLAIASIPVSPPA